MNFVKELRRLSEGCELGDVKDTLIKDVIIIGVTDKRLRERMLREPEINLDKAIQLGKTAEQTKLHSKELKDEFEVNEVRRKNREKEKQFSDFHEKNMILNCKFCGGSHLRKKCPAWGAKCFSCDRRNHS